MKLYIERMLEMKDKKKVEKIKRGGSPRYATELRATTCSNVSRIHPFFFFNQQKDHRATTEHYEERNIETSGEICRERCNHAEVSIYI